MFWNKSIKKELNSAEYEALAKKIVDCRADVEQLRADVAKLDQAQHNLRGIMNRKLKNIVEEETAAEEKPQNIKSSGVIFTGMHGNLPK